MSEPRGLRLNNPGNLRITMTPWEGKITPSKDAEFETFDCIENGIRALGKNLLSYFNFHGLKTIRDIIRRYAPATENNTEAYITAVADRTGYDPDANLNLNEYEDLRAIAEAIMDQEQGAAVKEISQDQIDEGIQRSLR